MPSAAIHVRFPSPLAEAVQDFAHVWHVTVSELVRSSVLYMIRHPEIYGNLVAARLAAIPQTSTPEQMAAAQEHLRDFAASYDLGAIVATMGTAEQRRNAQQYLESLRNFSLDDIVAEMGHDRGDEDGYK
jgi:hypothetical protein